MNKKTVIIPLTFVVTWNNLFRAVGGKRHYSVSDYGEYYWSEAGGKLKSKTRWKESGNGSDDYGFSALPGGYRWDDGSDFENTGLNGYWWSATEGSESHSAYSHFMSGDFAADKVFESISLKGTGFSVRCIQASHKADDGAGR